MLFDVFERARILAAETRHAPFAVEDGSVRWRGYRSSGPADRRISGVTLQPQLGLLSERRA